MVNVFTCKQVADKFGVTKGTVSDWAKAGKIEAVMFSGVWMIAPSALAVIPRLLSENPRAWRHDLYLPMPDEQAAEYLPIAEAAAAIGRDEMTLRRWMKARKLQGYREGKLRVMVARSDVAEIRARVEAGEPPFTDRAA